MSGVSMERVLAELTRIAADHPFLMIVGLALALLSAAVHVVHFLVRGLAFLAALLRQHVGEVSDFARRSRDELRLQPIDSFRIRSISIEEARAHLQRRGIEPSATIRVVAALAEAWLSNTAHRSAEIAVNKTLQADLAIQRYRLHPASLGSVRQGVNLDKALVLADALEDEQLSNKIEQRK